MKVLSVVGARPQFVKLAPVHRALAAADYEHVIIHTGQHYDYEMSDVFFRDLGIPTPDLNLAVGSASHAQQTSRMLEPLEEAFKSYGPDWVLVYGDTNSTLAAAIAAVKIHKQLAHLEAGLRSFNRFMPEEHNRVLTDHASDLLLAPTEVAARNLRNEGLASRTVVVGDVMTDVCMDVLNNVRLAPPVMPPDWTSDTQFVVSTIHRQENTDEPNRLRQIIEHLATSKLTIRLLAHPRLRAKAKEYGIELCRDNIEVFEPLAYPQLVFAVDRAAGVVTDSGGLQKEAFLIGTPCITLRTETEWVETVESGWNLLDPACVLSIDDTFVAPRLKSNNPYGDGHAALRVVKELEVRL
jgi:UDP-N-acetylglucosamine 2-epimerase (non-hydrolysing)